MGVMGVATDTHCHYMDVFGVHVGFDLLVTDFKLV
jgi:hypothetical protein